MNRGRTDAGGDPARLLNFGCGGIFHRDWVNLDGSAISRDIIVHDLRRPLPFPDRSFDAAYGSHVLEHLDPDAATRLLADCHRVLKPGGILRIVVPDLETIARLYLKSLVDASAGHSDAAFRYEWMMLELYDQTVRAVPGGRMARYIAEGRAQEETRFIRNRIGDEALEPEADARPLGDAPPWWRAMRRTRAITSTLRTITAEAFAFVFLGPRGVAALREGLFRASGEVHRWMYDRFSLQRALEQAGFREVHVCAADESGIPQFARYGLESRAGQPRKPDSLYVEGHKSEAS